MAKYKFLLILPFFAGLILIVYSWYTSFPLSISSVNDSIFNQVSIFYWISISLLLTSMFMMAVSFKNKYFIWLMAVGSVITIYSLSYFFFSISSSDAIFFRGLTANFINTQNLSSSQIIHAYYQWPLFFILSEMVTSISGLALVNFEFLLFTIIGFIISSSLYVYASKVFDWGSFLAVVAFFIVMYYFLNYQAVPFSLAFGLLFILFILDTHKKSASIVLTMLILYSSITITHAFVPLFFVLFLLIKSIVSSSKQYTQYYFRFLMLALVIYFLVQITLGRFTFLINIIQTFNCTSEYSIIAETTFAAPIQVQAQTDVTAQLFSRAITIVFAFLCFVGFVILAIKRKMRETDKAIFLSGVIYIAAGFMLSALGSRAIALVFIPISFGISYLYKNKFRPYLICLVLILLALFVFVPIHSSFATYPINYQTKEDLATTNFIIEKYDWISTSIVIADSGTRWYILTQIQGNTEIDAGIAPRFSLSNITNYDCIIYSVGLAHSIPARNNNSIEETSQQIMDKFDLVYNSGFSYIATKTR
jgi:hypothetical protein